MTLKSYAMFQEFPGIMEFPVSLRKFWSFGVSLRKDLKETPFKDKQETP
jgi:hypothetical protein